MFTTRILIYFVFFNLNLVLSTASSPLHAFELPAYQKETKRIIAREKDSMDLLLKGEIEYQKQILDVNFLKKREEAERKIVLERRGSSGGTFKLFGDSAYPNQIALNGISIAGQAILMVLDLSVSHMTVFQSSCVPSNPRKREFVDINSKNSTHEKRSATGGVCYANAYNFGKSTTASIMQAYAKDDDYGPSVVLTKRTFGLPNLVRVLATVQVVRDLFTVGNGPLNGGGAQFFANFYAYAEVLPDLPVPVFPVAVAAAAVAIPPVVQLVAVNLIGMAAPFPVSPGTAANAASMLLLNTAAAMAAGIAVPGANGAAGPSNPNGASTSSLAWNSRPRMKRTPTSSSDTTTLIDIPEIMFGNWNPDRFKGDLAWFPVSPIPGISINSLWILSLRSIQINPITPTALSSASIVANAHTNPSFDFGLLQFDTLITYILLTSERVAGIYGAMSASSVRSPSTATPWWTYKCNSPPSVSFEILDIHGVAQLMTLNPIDWFHGFSNEMGWCIGAIQPLPTGATRQLAGLRYLNSFYLVIQFDTSVTQSYRIGMAVNKRKGEI